MVSSMVLCEETEEMTFKLPRFVNPRNRDYTSYAHQLEQYNLAFQRELGEVMSSHLGDGSAQDLAALTTGSDGRLEKGPQSKVEIVISGRGDYSKEAQVITKEIGRELGDILHPAVEHKTLGTLYISGYNGDINRAFPTRVLDLRFLYGNQNVIHEAHDQLVYEVTSEAGKKIMDKMNELKRRARRISEKGEHVFKGVSVKHFDLERGVAFYDDENERGITRSAFKQGPIRLIQYGLAYEVLQGIKNLNFDLDLIDHLPTNTADRLFFFEAEGKTGLSTKEVEDLADSYKYFLWLYHLSQENFRVDGINETSFDREEVKSRLEDVVGIVDSKRIIN